MKGERTKSYESESLVSDILHILEIGQVKECRRPLCHPLVRPFTKTTDRVLTFIILRRLHKGMGVGLKLHWTLFITTNPRSRRSEARVAQVVVLRRNGSL